MFEFLIAQAPYAHLYILGLFFLAGFNVPVSEDVLFIAAAIISVKVVPENSFILFACSFIGAYGSDIICYWLGRKFGIKIVKVRPFSKLINEKRLNQMMAFYKKYGAMTLIIGRFIPFGVRNAIFLTSGISKMPFAKFASLDLIACSITSALLFSLGRSFANNYERLFELIKQFNMVLAAILVLGLAVFLLLRRKKTKPTP